MNTKTGLQSVEVVAVQGPWVALATTEFEPTTVDLEFRNRDAGRDDSTARRSRPSRLAKAEEHSSRLVRGWPSGSSKGPAVDVAVPVPGFRVNLLDFSGDGRRLVLADSDSHVLIWDFENPPVNGHPRVATEFETPANFVRFYAGGTRIFTASDKEIRIIDGQTYAVRLATPLGESRTIIETSPALPATVALGTANKVTLWVDRDDNRLDLTELPQAMARVSALVFGPDGKHLAVGREDGTIEIFDVATRRQVFNAWRHDGAVRSLAFSPDNARLVSAGRDLYAIVWSIRNANEVFRRLSFCRRILRAAFSSDGRRLVTASEDRTAKVWDGTAGRPIVSLDGHGAAVTDAAFAPQANLVATASGDGYSRLWDAETGRLVNSLRHPGELLAMQFGSRGGVLATASNRAAAAYLRSADIERRPVADVLAEIASLSRWKVENDALVDTRRPTVNQQAPSPSVPQGTGSRPEQVASAFLAALEKADREVLLWLLASDAEAGLRATVMAPAEATKEFGSLFSKRRFVSVVVRPDQRAALTTYEIANGFAGVWTVNELGSWKVRGLGARAGAPKQ